MRDKQTKHRRTLPASQNRTASLVQELLRPTEQRLKNVLDVATEGYWRWNTSSGELYLSEGWLASLGYSTATLPKEEGFFKSIVHGDDRAAFDSRLESCLAGNTESLDCECRLASKSGGYKRFRVRGKITRRDKSGRPLTMVGAILDVDAQKLPDEDLATHQAQAMAVFEATEDCIWIVDPVRLELMTFNKAMEERLFRARGIRMRVGMSPEELGPTDRAENWKAFYQQVLEQGRVSREHQLFSNQGTLHVVGHRLDRAGHVYGIAVFAHDITAQKQTESALRKSEEKFAKAFHESPLVFTLTSTRDHRYLEVNEAFEEATGYQREEVIGKTPFEMGIWVHPEARIKLVEELLKTGHIRNYEMLFRTRSGEAREAFGSITLIEVEGEPCMLSVVIDITERKRAAEALCDSEERLRIAIESGPMYPFEWDSGTDVVQCSEKGLRILNIPPEAVHTKREFIESIHPDDKEHYLKTVESLTAENPSYKVTYRFIRSDQKTIWLEESGRAIFEGNGKLQRVIGMASDVTEARQSERTLRELSGRLISSQEEERRRIARELHDHIGQELALLCVQAQRVDSGVSDEEQTRSADVHELYKRIKEIATDVSKLSHRLHSSELDFLGLSAAAERLCRDFANQHGIDVDYQIKTLPRLENAKALCFYRVLQEALQNVAKHSHASRVDVELRGVGGELVLKIIDSGVGFDVEKARYASGLGILSMRERLKLIGGRLQIVSSEGQGTHLVATVRIPAEST